MAKKDRKVDINQDSKDRNLKPESAERGERLTTNQGVRISDNQNSLKLGSRGPTLMEDFIFREKMTHFDHERIPERVVHARGSAAHGYFQPYESLAELTKASVFADPSVKTPVFARFSTVVGFRGSADTVRDVRGFAVKFYTADGNWDLVGNNMPVFFIQDGIKFPDLVHAIKPEPHNEMPQASAAHDNFWDFISLMPESMHMIMWVLSDRALPRSYAMMEGFGVHTFRLINDKGESRFAKFHWRPALGTHSLVWDEAQKLAGKDPDFNRRDLWMRIEDGSSVEFELCLQVVDEADEHKFDFDLLDATKLIPEEEVPLRPVGKMVLNRNPDNFFAETEQAAFHPGHVVSGIDFTNDPLLQTRLFSYLDTQLIRLGGPNFAEIPINRPVCPVHNNQRDGFMRQRIDKGSVNYEPNSLGNGCPMQSPETMRGFVSHAEKIDARKVRQRSPSFEDHYSQATLFWNSMSDPEKEHIVQAAHFELGKVDHKEIRAKMVEHFDHIDHDLARRVARGIGVTEPKTPATQNHGRSSPALSMENTLKNSIKTRKVAVLLADGFSHGEYQAVSAALQSAGAKAEIVSKFGGVVTSQDGDEVSVDKMFIAAASVMYDAVYIPGGRDHVDALRAQGDPLHFINEAFRHYKSIGATSEGVELLESAQLPGVALPGPDDARTVSDDHGVVTLRNSSDSSGAASKVKGAIGVGSASNMDSFIDQFKNAITRHRHWGRTQAETVPA